jgi:hypothetical protein
MNSSEFIPNDFEVFRRDRGSDPHGGVLVACRRSLVGSIVHIGKTTEFISIKVKLLHGKAVISAAYRPPNRTDGEYIEQLVKDITTVRSQYQSSYFILGGNFNLPDRLGILHGTDGEYIEQLVEDITTVRSQYQSSYFILGGDFNLPDRLGILHGERPSITKAGKRRVYIHAT